MDLINIVILSFLPTSLLKKHHFLSSLVEDLAAVPREACLVLIGLGGVLSSESSSLTSACVLFWALVSFALLPLLKHDLCHDFRFVKVRHQNIFMLTWEKAFSLLYTSSKFKGLRCQMSSLRPPSWNQQFEFHNFLRQLERHYSVILLKELKKSIPWPTDSNVKNQYSSDLSRL